MRQKLIGDKLFYKRVLALMIPIMIQNGITNLVNMLDNIMVGRVGTLEMTGVAIANQLIFVFNLCVFGIVSGAGIFGAQFYGKGDHDGVRYSFRFKMFAALLITVASIALFWFGGDSLIRLYLQGEGSAADAAASLGFARTYLRIMLIGLIPYSITQCYSSTLRECGQPTPPMVASVIAVAINLCLNSVLIFGLFGAPKLGAAGAAIATVISRFVELSIIVVWTRRHSTQNPFIIGAYRHLTIPVVLVRQILAKGFPLIVNETLWAAGMATLNQCYSTHGLDVVAANNITATFFNVFSVAFMAVGVSIGIILGQELGAGENDRAREDSRRLIFFSFTLALGVGALFALAAYGIPYIYNTTDNVRYLATRLMQITALAMPLDALANASYFTLRSGGKVITTFLFDSGFIWGICVTTAFTLSHYTPLGILWVYFICQMLNLVKGLGGVYLVSKDVWIKNIVD